MGFAFVMCRCEETCGLNDVGGLENGNLRASDWYDFVTLLEEMISRLCEGVPIHNYFQ